MNTMIKPVLKEQNKIKLRQKSDGTLIHIHRIIQIPLSIQKPKIPVSIYFFSFFSHQILAGNVQKLMPS